LSSIVVAELDLEDLLGKELNDGPDLTRRKAKLWNVSRKGDDVQQLNGLVH
jgi:hypothetical protein